MGTFKNTAITRDVRNSVGDQTFCKWKGLQIVKQKVGNNTSNTDAQQMQRKRWQTGMELDALFAAASVLGFPGRKRTHTPSNVFTHENVNDQIIEVAANPQATGEDDKWTATVNWESIRCAKGKLRLLRKVTVTLSPEGDTLSFTVTAEDRGPQREDDDELYALVVETELRDSARWSCRTTGTRRSWPSTSSWCRPTARRLPTPSTSPWRERSAPVEPPPGGTAHGTAHKKKARLYGARFPVSSSGRLTCRS